MAEKETSGMSVPNSGNSLQAADDQRNQRALPKAQKDTMFFTSNQIVIMFLGILALLLARVWSPIMNGYPDDEQDVSRPHPEVWMHELIGTVKWGDCDGISDLPTAECGYIVVPKDYSNPNAGVAKLALGRHKASVQPNAGMLFVNMGGPGAEGKPFATRHADLLRLHVGENVDIIGFDPRGVGNSEPKLQCFKANTPGRQYTKRPQFDFTSFALNTVLERGFDFPTNVSASELRQILIPQQRQAEVMLKTQVASCHRDTGDELKYMGTTTVARDVEFIANQLGGKDATINYYGMGYGSVLGQYLINMFPERVGRVVLDSVAGVLSWSSEPTYRWHKQRLNLVESAYESFFSLCSKAGPTECQLAKASNEDPAQIRQRLENFINDLYYAPLPVLDSINPGILTNGRVRRYLLSGLQVPAGWSSLAWDLAKAMSGDGTNILNHLDFLCPPSFGRFGAACNDGPNPPPLSAEDIVEEGLHVYQTISHFAFDLATSQPDAGCQYWATTPAEQFRGPWNQTLKSPILIVGNMASGKESGPQLPKDSKRLLVQGDSSYPMIVSPFCIAGRLKDYFVNGTLPPDGTVCPVELDSFSSWGHRIDDLSEDEDFLLGNLRGLGGLIFGARFHGYS